MLKNREITLHVKRTVQIKEYEPITLSSTIKASIDDDVKLDDASDKMWDHLEGELKVIDDILGEQVD